MAEHSAIEWTDATWNPTTGCTKVSPACANCYIERTPPFRVRGRRFIKGDIPIELHPDRLDAPLKRRKPTMYFVNSLSDLFHEDIQSSFIDRVFAVMALAPQHTFQVLTKRAERMRAYFMVHDGPPRLGDVIDDGTPDLRDRIDDAAGDFGACHANLEAPGRWPLPNVWLGVSVENQHFADERIPLLLQTPAAVRFISAEPLLEPVNLCPWIHADWSPSLNWWKWSPVKAGPAIDWVICGGESGPGARPCRPHWLRQIVEPCRVSKTTAVFVKQLGSNIVTRNDDGWEGDTPRSWPMDTNYDENINGYRDNYQGADVRVRLRDRKGGDPAEWPEDLRIRQYPEARA